jgi:hypothetical protein
MQKLPSLELAVWPEELAALTGPDISLNCLASDYFLPSVVHASTTQYLAPFNAVSTNPKFIISLSKKLHFVSRIYATAK